MSQAKLVGANREYIEQQIPHLSSLLCQSVEEVVSSSDVIVIGNKSEEFLQAIEQVNEAQTIVDLVRLPSSARPGRGRYDGICW